MTREWIVDPFEGEPVPERRRRPGWQRYAILVGVVLALGTFAGILAVLLVLILTAYVGS